MEKQQTLSVYRSRDEDFDNNDLKDMAWELTKICGKTVKIVSISEVDGEYLKIIISE